MIDAVTTSGRLPAATATSRKMRLAVFTNQFPGPVATFFARDIRALLDAGIEVDVFSIYPLQQSFWRHVPPILDHRVFPRSRVHHLGLGQSLTRLRPWNLRKCSEVLQGGAAIGASALRFGVVPLIKSAYVLPKAWAWSQRPACRYDHVLAYWGNYAATCAHMYCRLTEHSIPFSMFLHAGTDLYRDQVYLRRKLLDAERVFVVCQFNRDFIRQLYPDIFDRIAGKIFVHHLGLDVANVKTDFARPSTPTVIGVGRFAKEKGFDYLIRAAHALKGRGVDLRVELVGDGRESDALRKLASQLDMAQHVHFRGWLSASEVQEAMRQATVLVHPSTGLGDAVPTTIKEAMAVGTPVIGTDVAGIPELLDGGRCGLIVAPRDQVALADAIQQVLTDEALGHRLARVGRTFAETRFDMWRNGQRLARLLQTSDRATRPFPRRTESVTTTQ